MPSVSRMPEMDEEKRLHPLAPLTSWRIGGHAERFVTPTSVNRLSEYLQSLPENMPLHWLGLGSNLLVRDAGVKGVVIGTHKLQELYQDDDGSIVASAGVTCAKLARFACKRGFPEAAFFAGIPGTVGGALRMNAGAFGGETWEWVKEVSIITPQGVCLTLPADDFEIGYRHVLPKHEGFSAFLLGRFAFSRVEKDTDALLKIRELLKKRSQSQPIGTLNCGSVFKNPEGEHAARLIEASGLKGVQQGQALISPKHANFIINTGHAKASDVEYLMSLIQDTVKNRFGICLTPEVKIIGEAGEKQEK